MNFYFEITRVDCISVLFTHNWGHSKHTSIVMPSDNTLAELSENSTIIIQL